MPLTSDDLLDRLLTPISNRAFELGGFAMETATYDAGYGLLARESDLATALALLPASSGRDELEGRLRSLAAALGLP